MTLTCPPLSIVSVTGQDAEKILSNLTTNKIADATEDVAVETFVTEVRGRCVGHVMVIRFEDGFRLVGSAGQSEAIAALVDRYTIREDALATAEDDRWAGGFVAPTEDATTPGFRLPGFRVSVPWLGPPQDLFLTPKQDTDLKQDTDPNPDPAGAPPADPTDFHDQRVAAGFPWHGVDFGDRNLPQEADRTDQAISFTKGCYLGQETVARLDALGKVQKQLVRIELAASLPTLQPDDKVMLEGKPIARITSVHSGGGIVIAMARRGFLDAGAEIAGPLESSDPSIDGTPFQGVVR
ncbi:MAG: aminomethyltransferase [Planctomycetota bacterium]